MGNEADSLNEKIRGGNVSDLKEHRSADRGLYISEVNTRGRHMLMLRNQIQNRFLSI